jgi:hypothetical protein
MNLGVLNTIIAVVIVLLVLSLIVQAIQGFIKKLLRLKSSEIEGSLEDLYEQALSNTAGSPPTATVDSTRFDNVMATMKQWPKKLQTLISRVLGRKPAEGVPPIKKSPAEEFKDKILGEFRDIGRSSKWGNPVLDSLSKEDLLKIMAKLDSESLVPNYVKKFQEMLNELNKLSDAINALSENDLLTGSASAKLAEIRMVLAPLFYDVEAIFEGQTVKSGVLFGDLLRLGNIKLNRVPELLNDAQQAITQEIEVASKSNLPDRVKALNELSGRLAEIAVLVGNLSQKFDNAVAPLRIKLTQVETWYDTVMQSFDERYARSMKSVAIYISIVVVVLLNANFFNVYRTLSKNTVQTNLIVQNGPKVLEAAKNANATPSPTPTPSPTNSDMTATSSNRALPITTTAAPATSPEAPSRSAPAVSPEASPEVSPASPTTSSAGSSPAPPPSPTPVDIKKEAEETKQNIDVYVNMYGDFGFTPLSAEQARSWLWSTGGWTWLWGKEAAVKPNTNPLLNPRGFWGFTMTRNEKGVPLSAPILISKDEQGVPFAKPISVRKTIATDCHEVDNDGNLLTYADGSRVSCSPDWRPVTGLEWWESRKHDASVLFGWSIMVLLLSVGAPFWQDALESLFGVKNLLRQKSGTQNIEKESGSGQPKQS